MPFGIGPKIASGDVMVKGDLFSTKPIEATKAKKDEFVKKVDDSLKDGILTKAEYKSLKDSMVGGRSTLNDVLAKSGVASKGDLEKIFAKGKDKGTITVSTMQRDALKVMLTGVGTVVSTTTVLPEAELKQLDDFKKTKEWVGGLDENKDGVLTKHDGFKNYFPPIDRSDLSKKYTLKDFVFSPEISSIFKDHVTKEFSSENFDFMHDLKNALDNNDKGKLKEIYSKYVEDDSEKMINIKGKTRRKAKEVFENPDSTITDMVRALGPAAGEINRLMSDSFLRFQIGGGIAKAIHHEAMSLPVGSERVKYIDDLIKTPITGEPEEIESKKQIVFYAKQALDISTKMVTERLEA